MNIRTLSKIFILVTYVSTLTFSCKSVQKAEIVEDGNYRNLKTFNINAGEQTYTIKKNDRIYVEDLIDSIAIKVLPKRDTLPQTVFFTQLINQSLKLRQNSFDIDLFTVPFRIRPAQQDMPHQLNTSFNTSMYFGYRIDYLKVNHNPKSILKRREIIRNGLGGGLFLGMSSVTMNPWVTKNKISSEYDGLAITYGISTIYAVQKFNAGIALGFDYLTDKNKNSWIYHNKPWVGLLVGLNLN